MLLRLVGDFPQRVFLRPLKKAPSLNHQELQICLNHGKFSKIFFSSSICQKALHHRSFLFKLDVQHA